MPQKTTEKSSRCVRSSTARLQPIFHFPRCSKERYQEPPAVWELMIYVRPYPSRLLSLLYLTANAFLAQHYSIFPLALGQILREHAIPEFHLTINSGKWDYDRWGHPGEPGVGSGAELWAWMGDGAETRCLFVSISLFLFSPFGHE